MVEEEAAVAAGEEAALEDEILIKDHQRLSYPSVIILTHVKTVWCAK